MTARQAPPAAGQVLLVPLRTARRGGASPWPAVRDRHRWNAPMIVPAAVARRASWPPREQPTRS